MTELLPPYLARPLRPALRYPGGKWRLAPWIISHFPPHLTYVEPYMGAASVFIQKPPAPLEILNDLDGRVVNYFHILRTQPDLLIHQLHLTPWSRLEFERCKHPSMDPLEDARRFFVTCWQTFGRRMDGWRYERYPAAGRNPVLDLLELNHLLLIAHRFKTAQLECRPALDVITNFDTPTTLFYLDPPYLHSTRQGRAYLHEMTIRQHVQLAETLHTLHGLVLLSGYPSPLYRDLYERHGWTRHDIPSRTNRGIIRTESLWINPRAFAALSKPRNLPLF